MSGSDALREEVDELREEINQLKQENSRRVGRNNSETGELTQSTSSEFSRRGFLKAAGIMGAAAMLPSAASFRINSDRGLSYYNSSSADKSQLQVTPDGVLEAQQIGTTSNPINSIHSQLVNTENMNSVRVAESAEDIQPLIDELDGSGVTERPGGGVVQLKRGVYKPKKPIELQRGVQLRGLQHTINNDQNQQEFEYCAISGENLSSGDPIIKATDGADMVTVENLTLISGGTSNITGVQLTNITAPLLNNIRMNGLDGYGIFASGVFDGRARGMDVFNCGNISNSANAVYIEENPNTGNNSQMALNGSFTSIQKGESNTIIKLDGSVRTSLVGGANRRAHLKMRNPDNPNIFQVSIGLNSLFTMENTVITGENDAGVHGIEVKQDLTLLNSKIEKVDQGIVIKERGARSEYVNSQITSCTQDGVKTYGGVQVPRMLGCNASGNGGHGLNFSGGVGGTPISNISVLSNGGAGIRSDVRRGKVEINGIEATNNTNGPVSHPATVEVSQSLNTAWPIRTTGIATFSGDGATETFTTDSTTSSAVAHGLAESPNSTDRILATAMPVSADCIAGAPVQVYPRDADSDGKYEALEFKFTSAPPSGTDNLKFRWEAKLDYAF